MSFKISYIRSSSEIPLIISLIIPETLILLISPDLSEDVSLGAVTDLEAGYEAEQLVRGRHLETLLTEEVVDIGAISEKKVETWRQS